jgi:tetratricopeptide (TPR) repeat protein
MNGDGKLVPFDRARRRMNPAGMAEFAATARRLLREREVSEDVVTRALRETPREQWGRLAERIELRTSGALERFSKEVEKRLDTDPREALALAELATHIADSLGADAYPAVTLAQVRADAWRDRGQALSYLGRYDEALRALDHAEEQLHAFGTLAHDRAIVRFVRGIVLQHVRRFDEAHAILEDCRAVFRAHLDNPLYAKCTLATGNLLVRKGDYRGAREMLSRLLGTGDSQREATIRCTLGWCAIHLGEHEDALTHFAEVRRCTADAPLHAARAAYGSGSALLRLGMLDAAIDNLRAARKTFLDHNLIEEAGLSGLEIVEARLLQSDFNAAQALSAVIVNEFTSANLNRRAVTALAYLNDAVGATRATPETARNVHSYLTALRTDPTCEFTAIN